MEMLISGIRAVMLCLDVLAMENLAETVVNAITSAISLVIADIQEIIGNIMQGTVTEITRVVEEKVVGETREMLKGEFAQLREAPRATADWQTTRPSYASMTARETSTGMEREHQVAMAKGTLQKAGTTGWN